VAEKNFGGDMVESNLRGANVKARVVLVHASRGKQVRAEPVAGLYDQCVAGDTLIACERGEVPIRDVRVGDRVWTRVGLRRVLWSGQTGVSETMTIASGGKTLRLTANHPVLTDTGWVDAGHLDHKRHTIFVWQRDRAKFVRQEFTAARASGYAVRAVQSADGKSILGSFCARMWNLGASAISGRTTATGELLATRGRNFCIAPFGRRITAETSPMGGMSTIAMATQATTRQTTWRRFLRAITPTITTPKGRSRGCAQRSAWSAAAASLVGGCGRSFARRNAGGSDTPTRNADAEPVFNLHVEGQHEYVANGILVHYCRIRHKEQFPLMEAEMLMTTPAGYQGEESPNRMDALVWAVTELNLADRYTYDLGALVA
jgi:hypothetical protein